MESNVTQNITDYMNSRRNKHFSYYQVSAISAAIKTEYYERKAAGSAYVPRTKAEKEYLNNRIAEIANKSLFRKITGDDVHLYKKCREDEYSNRTNKCAWGYRNTRDRQGYDITTGLERDLLASAT